MMADEAFYGQTILGIVFVVKLIRLFLRQGKMGLEILVYLNKMKFRTSSAERNTYRI